MGEPTIPCPHLSSIQNLLSPIAAELLPTIKRVKKAKQKQILRKRYVLDIPKTGQNDRFYNDFAAKRDFSVVIVTYSKPSKRHADKISAQLHPEDSP